MRRHADRIPGLAHRLLRVAAEAVPSIEQGAAGEMREIGLRAELRIADRVVPDLPGLLPGTAAERLGGEIEGMVRYPRVDVDTAAVLLAVDEIGHSGGLRVLVDERIVVSRAGRLERAEGLVRKADQHAL